MITRIKILSLGLLSALSALNPTVARPSEEVGILDRRIDSLLRKAPSVEYFLKVVNLIRWDSWILTSIPSISPVRIAETRHIAHAISSPFEDRIHPIFHTHHAPE